MEASWCGLKEEPHLIYENPLAGPEDIADFLLEGEARLTFPEGRLRMENARSAREGQKANYVLWCPKRFPSDLLITWDFWPIQDPGLCILFFAAAGRSGEDLFAPSLQPRTGEYPQYHHGEINAFHVSYFRRKEADERAFHTCNLRKSYGFHLVAQGGDPIPDIGSAVNPYHLAVVKKGERISFYINELEIFRYLDDGQTYGPRLQDGRIGFRQLAPLIAEYSSLRVYRLGGQFSGEPTMNDRENFERIQSLIENSQGMITMAEVSEQLNYHPSYIWKIMKRHHTTFTDLVNAKKAEIAKELLEKTALSVSQISSQLGYANTQNFIRFFNKEIGTTPGGYRRENRNSMCKKSEESPKNKHDESSL